ncbi:MAG: GDP-mannose 4,6-dehydratase [Actinomycetota bacterium]
MRVLVTGAGGFVGRHLVEHLRGRGDQVVTWSGGAGSPDIRQPDELRTALGGEPYEAIYHLAAQSRVDLSWSQPSDTLAVNAGGTANLMRALDAVDSAARVLLMSSAEVYGAVDDAALPIDEEQPLVPRSPYGVSKAAAEELALLLGEASGRDVVICRPFNQIGPGQADTFVTAALARQVVALERTGGGTIAVGNLTATRDFLDVRDAVEAYRCLMESGAAGETYNVCSSQETVVRSILDGLVASASVEANVEIDPQRFRPNDLPRMAGSSSKLRSATGWAPHRALSDTLADVLEDWRRAE